MHCQTGIADYLTVFRAVFASLRVKLAIMISVERCTHACLVSVMFTDVHIYNVYDNCFLGFFSSCKMF